MENQEIKHYPNDHIARVMADSFKLIESAYDSKESLWPGCIGTGISALDEITGGIDETDLVVVSGLTGTGKTSFIVSILSLLIEAKTPVIAIQNLAKKNEVNRDFASEIEPCALFCAVAKIYFGQV